MFLPPAARATRAFGLPAATQELPAVASAGHTLFLPDGAPEADDGPCLTRLLPPEPEDGVRVEPRAPRMARGRALLGAAIVVAGAVLGFAAVLALA